MLRETISEAPLKEATGLTALRVETLSGGYGRRKLFTGVDFSLDHGESVALLGENGAGKSTLLRMIAGRQRPSAGRVQIAGKPALSLAARRRMAYAPQFLDYPPGLRVDELQRFVSGIYGIKARACGPWGRAFGIEDLLGKQADRLSGGEAKRLALSLAFDSEAPLLLLDEPAASLDRHYLSVLHDALHALRGKRTVLFVSHALPASLAGRHRLLHLEQGLLGSGAPAHLTAAAEPSLAGRWRLRFRAPDCPPLAGALHQACREADWEVIGPDGDALVRQLVSLGVDFRGLEVTRLEDQHG